MKRVDFFKYLHEHSCEIHREGGRHTVVINPLNNQVSSVPRHRELNDFLIRKICRDLDIPHP